MREVFGDARLTTTPEGFGLEAPGLHCPAPLLSSTAGVPVPDLTDHLGRVVHIIGALEAPGDNLNILRVHCNELHLAADADLQPSMLWGVVSGNLGRDKESGKAGSFNPKRDRVSASLAYAKEGNKTSWLQIISYAYYASAELLAEQEAGVGVTCYGAIETYQYNDKPRVQLSMRGFQLSRQSGPGHQAPVTLMSSRSRDDIAPQADAFTEA